ncbi:MAG: nitrous oxide-stimulated promoter family protein [Actinomycetota bacterium]|nr:nitrous oxide-stimulated promoter family protein [Actinomycetota bacterium]MDZ4179568.1 nitrous oxide-stimulated promoter family protein [Coriobacteriia bacterium]
MDELFEQRMRDARVAHDTRLLGDFAVIYCRGVHGTAQRNELQSAAATLGVYGRKTPVVCEECADLLRYAEDRRARCPKDPKPFCSHCDTHCYRPAMREQMREVMKYSGPRSIVRGHAIDSIRHLVESRKGKRASASPGAAKTRSDS